MEHQDHLVIASVEKKQEMSMSDDHVELKEKHELEEKLQQTRNNLNSSSDEEVAEGGEGKKRKKKGLKDRIKDKISRADDHKTDDHQEAPNSGEKKGFLDKIIEKLPGQHNNKTEEGIAKDPPDHESPSSGDEKKEKKGIFDRIKEKLPGHNKNDDEAKKDK